MIENLRGQPVGPFSRDLPNNLLLQAEFFSNSLYQSLCPNVPWGRAFFVVDQAMPDERSR